MDDSSLGYNMSRESAVLAGRAAAESGMVDTCRITRPGTGDPVRDPDTGELVPPPTVVVYEGKCRIKTEVAAVEQFQSGERQVNVVRFVCSVPVSEATKDIRIGNRVEVLTSLLDPGLPGKEFIVGAGFVGSQITARRLPVDEVAS